MSKCLATVAAVSFLVGAIGYAIGRDSGPEPNAVDIGFYKDMLTHHDQAIDMSLLVMENGEDPTVRIFAQEIATFQSYEIGLMNAAMRSWGETVDRPDTSMSWMNMPVPYEYMPGLASDEQMSELRQATGREADELFLELMADHHRGGIHMAQYAADRAAEPDTRELAARMARNQIVEIDEYRQAAERLGLDVDIEPYGGVEERYGG